MKNISSPNGELDGPVIEMGYWQVFVYMGLCRWGRNVITEKEEQNKNSLMKREHAPCLLGGLEC